ncbi:MAG: flagellar basal-body rod protein FlgF [Hansschlegelia sp.]
MENASLVGLSRQVALRRELDVVANNVANMNSSGFKSDEMVFSEFLMPKARDDTFRRQDRTMSFVEDRATIPNFAPGELQTTESDTDIAIDGEGFFVVDGPDGPRYTRNGSFRVGRDGVLVTSEGDKVMSSAGPIRFGPNETGLSIGADGTISTSEGLRGRLRVVRFANMMALRKETATTFSSSEDPSQAAADTTRVVQHAVEKSNVRGIAEMSRLVEVTRAYENISTMLQKQDEMRQTAVERLADVPS